MATSTSPTSYGSYHIASSEQHEVQQAYIKTMSRPSLSTSPLVRDADGTLHDSRFHESMMALQDRLATTRSPFASSFGMDIRRSRSVRDDDSDSSGSEGRSPTFSRPRRMSNSQPVRLESARHASTSRWPHGSSSTEESIEELQHSPTGLPASTVTRQDAPQSPPSDDFVTSPGSQDIELESPSLLGTPPSRSASLTGPREDFTPKAAQESHFLRTLAQSHARRRQAEDHDWDGRSSIRSGRRDSKKGRRQPSEAGADNDEWASGFTSFVDLQGSARARLRAAAVARRSTGAAFGVDDASSSWDRVPLRSRSSSASASASATASTSANPVYLSSPPPRLSISPASGTNAPLPGFGGRWFEEEARRLSQSNLTSVPAAGGGSETSPHLLAGAILHRGTSPNHSPAGRRSSRQRPSMQLVLDAGGGYGSMANDDSFGLGLMLGTEAGHAGRVSSAGPLSYEHTVLPPIPPTPDVFVGDGDDNRTYAGVTCEEIVPTPPLAFTTPPSTHRSASSTSSPQLSTPASGQGGAREGYFPWLHRSSGRSPSINSIQLPHTGAEAATGTAPLKRSLRLPLFARSKDHCGANAGSRVRATSLSGATLSTSQSLNQQVTIPTSPPPNATSPLPLTNYEWRSAMVASKSMPGCEGQMYCEPGLGTMVAAVDDDNDTAAVREGHEHTDLLAASRRHFQAAGLRIRFGMIRAKRRWEHSAAAHS